MGAFLSQLHWSSSCQGGTSLTWNGVKQWLSTEHLPPGMGSLLWLHMLHEGELERGPALEIGRWPPARTPALSEPLVLHKQQGSTPLPC